MTKIRLIASDLDGTLLKNGAQTLNPETCGLINELLGKGIRFAAASGRQPDNLCRLFEPVKDRIDYVCQNGSSAVADGKQLVYYTIEPESAREAADEIRRTPGMEVFVSCFERSYAERGNVLFYKLMKEVIKVDTEAIDDILAVTDKCAKISFYEEAGISRMEYWQKKYGDRMTVVPGGEQWLDFMPKGINKQVALKALLEYRGIRPEEVMVFGDNLNDLEMLEYAGCGAAVENAVPGVLAAADAVVSSVEDAIREVLKGRDQIEDWVRK